MTQKHSMAWYFDRGLERNALLLDASNLDWFEFPLFSCIRSEIYRTLEDPAEDMDWGYSYPGGKSKLRTLIAEHESGIEKNNIVLDDVVVVGNGVTGVLNFLAQFLKDVSNETNKNKILYPIPSYSGILKSIEHYKLETITIKTSEENNFLISYKDVIDNYTSEVLAIIITNPGNPVCKYIPETELKKILSFCKEKGIYIILDAIFEESPSKKANYIQSFNLLQNYDKLIKIKGFSKDIPQLGDLRLGWSICKNKKINDYLLSLCEITNFSNSTFLEALAIVEMQQRVWIDQGKKSISTETYQKERKKYHKKIFSITDDTIAFLQKNPVIERIFKPDAGNILFIKLAPFIKEKYNIQNSHDLFVYILEKENILVTPGHVFGLDLDELWFRVTISRSKEAFFDGLERIVNLFK